MILVGTKCLNELLKYFNVDKQFTIHDLDYLVLEDEIFKSQQSQHDLNLDLINIENNLNFMKPIIDKYGINNVTINVNDELIASPFLLYSTYVNRKNTQSYKENIKIYKDVFKIRELKNIFTDNCFNQLCDFCKTNDEFKKLHNDWIFDYENPYLYRINFLPEHLVIANEFAIMFYMEFYNKQKYDYKSLDIEVYGNINTINIVGSRVISIGSDINFNEYNLQRNFKIETIESLLTKDFDDNIKDILNNIKIQNQIK